MKKNLFFVLIFFTAQTTLTMNRSQPIKIFSSSPPWGTSQQLHPSSPNWEFSPPKEVETTAPLTPGEKLLILLQKKLNALSDQRRCEFHNTLRATGKDERLKKQHELFTTILTGFGITPDQKASIGGIPLSSLQHTFFENLLNH